MISTITKELTVGQFKAKPLTRNKNIAKFAGKVYRVFIADNDPKLLKRFEHYFSEFAQYQVMVSPTGKDCISEEGQKADIVVLGDYSSDKQNKAGSKDRLRILKELKNQNPDVQVIMLSKQMEVQVAVDCLKRGAVNYVVKSRVMQFNIKEAMDAIVKSREIKAEIGLLSNTIKRDKLLLRGYGLLMVAFSLAIYYY